MGMSRGAPGRGRGPRVIAGEAGGRRLVVPLGTRTRPTADRVKEALFAALGPSRIIGTHVLDGFAGSGALAIEALSRGASRALLVDRDPLSADAIRRNLQTTGLADRAAVQRRGLGTVLRSNPPDTPFDLVFLDPPYDYAGTDLGAIILQLSAPGWVSNDGTIVIERAESSGPPSLPPEWMVTWDRVYGDTLIVIAARDSGIVESA